MDTSVALPGSCWPGLSSANLETALAVVSAASYRDDLSLVASLEALGFSQLILPGDSDGTSTAANAAFDSWITTVNGQPTAVIAFRGTDDIETDAGGVTALTTSADSRYWLDTEGYYDLLAEDVAAFDSAVAAMGISQVYVTGHSLGGGAAQAYMAAHDNTTQASYNAIVYGSLGLSGTDDTPGIDSRVTAMADASDPATLLGTQTAALSILFQASPSPTGPSLDPSALMRDPGSLMGSHGITAITAAAGNYDAAKTGQPMDATTFFTTILHMDGLTCIASPLA